MQVSKRITFGNTVRRVSVAGGCVVSQSQPGWLRRVREHLHDGAAELDLGEICSGAGVHPRHLMRAFRRYVGCSIGEYVRRARIRRAQHLLADTEASVAAIALEVGFYDQSHFTRTFRRVTGLSPRQYRRLTM